jgi:PAS domain S-box-containing protein
MGEASQSRGPDTQLFRDVFNASPIGIVVENLEGQPLFVNPAFCSMLGFNEEELRSKHCVDFSPREDAVRDWGLFQQLRAGSIDHYQLEKRYFRRDGSLVWGRLSLSLLNGRPSPMVLAMVEDITEQKQAENAIRESEMQYRRIVETTNEGVWLLDSKLHTSYVNRQMAEVLGHKPGEMVGRSVLDFYFPEDVERKKQRLERRQQGLRESFEERLQRRDGSELWVRMTATPVFKDDGEFDGALAMMSDITEEKRTKEALRISEERLHLAQWAAHIGTFDVNIRTGVDIWQPELEALYGLPPGGFGGTLTAFEGLIHPHDRERVTGLTQEMIRTGQPAEAEWRVVWPDGSVHWVAGRGQVLMDDSGEPSRMLGVNIDITERKLAEAALSGMTRKLVEAQEQERARIARELHDDINQRLALLAVECGQLQNDPSNVQVRMQDLQIELAQISEDVQALSHELHSSNLDYLGVVAGIRSWCKEFGERQKMEIVCTHDVRSILPTEIGLCLFRVLQEALHNAVKHSRVKRVEVRLTEQSNEIHLIISDSGAGFDVEAARQGTGLGLTSMQERVRLMNGTISIESKPMGGTTIRVRVPFDSAHGAQRAAG